MRFLVLPPLTRNSQVAKRKSWPSGSLLRSTTRTSRSTTPLLWTRTISGHWTSRLLTITRGTTRKTSDNLWRKGMFLHWGIVYKAKWATMPGEQRALPKGQATSLEIHTRNPLWEQSRPHLFIRLTKITAASEDMIRTPTNSTTVAALQWSRTAIRQLRFWI